MLDFAFQEHPSGKCRENKDHLHFFVLCEPGLPGCGVAGLAQPGCNKSQELESHIILQQEITSKVTYL